MMNKLMNEMMKPAIANPLGLLNNPIKENKAPKNHKIQFTTGAHENRNDNNANTNPAVPMPFVFFCMMIVC